MEKIRKQFEQKHGAPDFPIRVYPLSSIGCEGVTFCNWHSDYEIVYITKGELDFNVGALQTPISAGQGAIVDGERIHHLHYKNESYLCEGFIIWFDPHIVNLSGSERAQKQFIAPLFSGKYHINEKIEGKNQAERNILESIVKIRDLYQDQPLCFEVKIIAELLNIFYEVISNHLYHPSDSLPNAGTFDQSERLKSVLTYIDEHYTDRIYVSDLASLLNMSVDNFFKYFKEFTHMTPTDYINRYRVGQAEWLLRATNTPIAEVSTSTGFDNVSYFIKTFKKYHGETPNRFRKRNGPLELPNDPPQK